MQATIVGYEPEKDLAVLKIPSKNLPTPISVGSSNDLQVGQNVRIILICVYMLHSIELFSNSVSSSLGAGNR